MSSGNSVFGELYSSLINKENFQKIDQKCAGYWPNSFKIHNSVAKIDHNKIEIKNIRTPAESVCCSGLESVSL